MQNYNDNQSMHYYMQQKQQERKRITLGYLSQHAFKGTGFELLSGINDAVKKHDVNLISISGGMAFRNEISRGDTTIFEFLNTNNIDGLITWTLSLNSYMEPIEIPSFLNNFFPLPVVSISLPVAGIPSIMLDNEAGIRYILEHLIDQHGFKKIAFVKANSNHFYSEERFKTYKKVLSERGIPYNEDLVVNVKAFAENAGTEAVHKILERNLVFKQDIEAIVTVSDQISLGVINELRKNDIRIPRDVAVTGFNNTIESRSIIPAITTVESNFYQHGYKAVEVLIANIRGENITDHIYLPTHLVVRQSCGCLEPTIENAAIYNKCLSTEANNSSKSSNEQSILDINIDQVSTNLFQSYPHMKEMLGNDWAKSILENLWFDLYNNNSQKFINRVNNYISRSRSNVQFFTDWQNIISHIRSTLKPYIYEANRQFRFENIINQTRVLIYLAIVYLPDFLILQATNRTSNIVELENMFNSTFQVSKLMDEFGKYLPKLGVEGCYLSIYNRKDSNPHLTATLTLAFNEDICSPIDNGGITFNPKLEILPKEVLPTRRFSMMFEPLYFKDTQLGFIAFEMGPIDGALYEILRSSFSTALQGALYMEERTIAEKEKELLLNELGRKNFELEQRIEERTSDIRNINEKLRDAMDEANRANSAKSMFLANMSHEIRTPLNCILGFAQIINDVENKEQRHHYQKLIIDETEKLLELVNQVLDISKIESGKFRLNEEPFDIYKLMDSITLTFSDSASRKGLTFEVNLSEYIPQYVIGDSLRLRQILVNLISNSVKFTHHGGISVRVDIEKSEEDVLVLLFQVIDSGIGIRKERQNHIFELFVQEEASTTRKYGGSGLGTSISKQLVTLMNGNIGLNSQFGKGSNFWFTAKLKKSDKLTFNKNEPMNPKQIEKLYIECKECKKFSLLLVEDYPSNQKVALHFLKSFNCKVFTADNGKDALEKFYSHHIDIILMDIQMPIMDGIEATLLIRNHPQGRDIPIIALTANAFEGEIKKYLKIGMSDVITKPFKKHEFLERIYKWVCKIK